MFLGWPPNGFEDFLRFNCDAASWCELVETFDFHEMWWMLLVVFKCGKCLSVCHPRWEVSQWSRITTAHLRKNANTDARFPRCVRPGKYKTRGPDASSLVLPGPFITVGSNTHHEAIPYLRWICASQNSDQVNFSRPSVETESSIKFQNFKCG